MDGFDAEERRLFEQRDARADRLEAAVIVTLLLGTLASAAIATSNP